MDDSHIRAINLIEVWNMGSLYLLELQKITVPFLLAHLIKSIITRFVSKRKLNFIYAFTDFKRRSSRKGMPSSRSPWACHYNVVCFYIHFFHSHQMSIVIPKLILFFIREELMMIHPHHHLVEWLKLTRNKPNLAAGLKKISRDIIQAMERSNPLLNPISMILHQRSESLLQMMKPSRNGFQASRWAKQRATARGFASFASRMQAMQRTCTPAKGQGHEKLPVLCLNGAEQTIEQNALLLNTQAEPWEWKNNPSPQQKKWPNNYCQSLHLNYMMFHGFWWLTVWEHGLHSSFCMHVAMLGCRCRASPFFQECLRLISPRTRGRGVSRVRWARTSSRRSAEGGTSQRSCFLQQCGRRINLCWEQILRCLMSTSSLMGLMVCLNFLCARFGVWKIDESRNIMWRGGDSLHEGTLSAMQSMGIICGR